MKLDTTYINNIRKTWTRLLDYDYERSSTPTVEAITVVGKGSKKAMIEDWYWVYVRQCDGVPQQLAFKINKCHWAKGRKMQITSKVPSIPSGEYVIIHKAESNSYDHLDFVVVEFVDPPLDTPRKALNWLEKRVAELEALDGVTTEELVAALGVRRD